MRWRIIWAICVATAAFVAYLFNFDWPPKFGVVVSALAQLESWWSAHAANPILSAFLVGVLLGTAFLPELWLQIRPHLLPLKIRPDLDGAEAFKTITLKSRRAKELVKGGLLTKPLGYESHLTELGVIEGRLRQQIENELHDLLRLGEITAFGTPDGKKPYEKIEPSNWSALSLDLSDIDRDGSPAMHAAKIDAGTGVMSYGYVWIKFCSRELYREYPLAWYPRRKPQALLTKANTPQPEPLPTLPKASFSSQALQTPIVDSKKQVVVKSYKNNETSGLNWNFERDIAFIGMSAGPEQQILIHNFQARGKNLTGDPIEKLNGYIRSDRTAQQFPVLFNLKGKATPLCDVTVPVGAIIDIHAAFSNDRTPISLREFLTEMVPFTFIFEYDGKSVRRTVTLGEVEERVSNYSKIIRQSLIKAPEASVKSQRNIAALNKSAQKVATAMNDAVERMIFGTNDQDEIAKKMEDDDEAKKT